MAQALAVAELKKQKNHAMECVNCRKLLKVPVLQMRRALPPEEEPEEETADE
jgi:hypothetical protein